MSAAVGSALRPRHWAGFAAVAVLLSLWPSRAALLAGEIPGAGPDVVSTTWGMWWFSQTLGGAAWGEATDLVNVPYGAYGSVLAPVTAAVWALADLLVGVVGATQLVIVGQIALTGLGCAWLAARAGAGPAGALAALVAALAARFWVFGSGEGSLVAVAVLPVILGLGLSLGAARDGKRAWLEAGLLALCLPLVALDNPYLAAVLPGVLAVVLVRDLVRRRVGPALRRGAALVFGSLGILGVVAIFSQSAHPDYPKEVAGQTVQLLGLGWEIVDLPWARAGFTELLWPGEVRWTVGANDARSASGGRYLGLVGALLAVMGAVVDRRARPWMVLGLVALALSFGSLVGPAAGPFLFYNALMDAVARPLTQPTRFLAVVLVAASVPVGLGVHALVARFGKPAIYGVIGVLGIEAMVVGGPSLELPTTSLPAVPCASSLSAGAVLSWPHDALDGDDSASRLLQISHAQPAAHRGIASWRLGEDTSVVRELRRAGWGFDLGGRAQRPDGARLARLGYRWALVTADAGELPDGLGDSTPCGAYSLHRLGP